MKRVGAALNCLVSYHQAKYSHFGLYLLFCLQSTGMPAAHTKSIKLILLH